jgi:hypothetical protein
MRKLVVLAVFAALTFPASAAAKEISAAKICGASGCVTTTDKAALMQLAQSSDPSPTAPAMAPYYELRFQVTEPGRGLVGASDAWWVPSARLMAARSESGTPEWSRLTAEGVAFLDRTAANVTPYPTPRFMRVLVGARRARDPNSYRGVFDHRWRIVYDSASDWIPITITTSARNPWTDGLQLLYSPGGDMLWFGVERVHVPSRFAANIEARRSLDAPAQRPSRAWAWALGAAAIACASAAAAVRSRRR